MESKLLYSVNTSNSGTIIELVKSNLLPKSLTAFGIINGDYDYDPSKPYNKGDFCIFRDGDSVTIIQAKKDIPAGTDFDSKSWNFYNFENGSSATASSALDDRPDIVANIISHNAANNGMYGQICKSEVFEDPEEYPFSSLENPIIRDGAPIEITKGLETDAVFLLYFDIMFFNSDWKRVFIDPLLSGDFYIDIYDATTDTLLYTYKPNDVGIPSTRLSDLNKKLLYVNTYAVNAVKVKINNLHFEFPDDIDQDEELIIKIFDIYTMAVQ